MGQTGQQRQAWTLGLSRFALVGVLGFVIDASVLTLLVNGFGHDHFTSRAISFSLAVTATWLANRRWTFEPTEHRGKEYAGYLSTQLVGAIINLGIYVLLIQFIPSLAKTPVIPLACGAFVALLFNFASARWLVYSKIRSTPQPATGISTDESGFTYSGVDNLEAMRHAKNYNQYLTDLVKRHVDGIDVLDFGAGAGTFAEPVSHNRTRVSCLEPDAVLRGQLADDGFQTFAELSAVPRRSLDTIYTLNVLEHIEDDQSTLRELGACLRDSGRLIVYVPAFTVLFSAMDQKVGHFRRYGRPDLVAKLAAAGFRIRHARYVDSLGFLVTLLYKLVDQQGSGDISPGSVKIYDRFIFPLSLLVDRLTGGRFGKNLLVVADRD
jgi:putative flippase GtrA